MEQEKLRAWNIMKRMVGFFGTLLMLFLIAKFSVYFMPFFIAGLIALIIEPIIKFNMNKLKMSRRMSSFIVVIITIILLITTIVLGGSAIVSNLINFSKNIPSMVSYVTNNIQEGINSIAEDNKDYLSEETILALSNSVSSFVNSLGTYVQSGITSLLQIVLSVPRIIVNVIITILALVIFTKDRVAIIDLLEYHVPEAWFNKAVKIKKELFHTIGLYLKIYSKILIITTIELLIAFAILRWIGFDIKNTIPLSIVIAIVDILPVLGVGTVLIPWFIWSFITGDIGFGVALLIVYLAILIIRQIIEPKLVSDQLGVHPIITLLAMYAGFKLIGFSGLILGPIALVILRCVYAEQIKKGLLKSLVED